MSFNLRIESEFIAVSGDRMGNLLLDMVHVHDPDFMDSPLSFSINVIFVSEIWLINVSEMGTCACSPIVIITAEVLLFSLLEIYYLAYKRVSLRVAAKVFSVSLKTLYDFAFWRQCFDHNMIYFVYFIWY